MDDASQSASQSADDAYQPDPRAEAGHAPKHEPEPWRRILARRPADWDAGRRLRVRLADRRRGRQELAPPQSWRRVSGRGWILPGVARFEGQDLTEAEFRECDLTRARLIGVVMQDAVIDGLVSNLVVN